MTEIDLMRGCEMLAYEIAWQPSPTSTAAQTWQSTSLPPVRLHCNGEAGGLCEDHTAGQGIPGAAMHAHFLRIWTVVQLRTSLLDLQVCESPGSHCSQAWLPRGGKAHHCHPVRLQCNGGAGGLCEDHRAGQGISGAAAPVHGGSQPAVQPEPGLLLQHTSGAQISLASWCTL